MKKSFTKPLALIPLFFISAFFGGRLQAQPHVFIFGHLITLEPLESNLKYNYRYGAGGEGSLGLGLGHSTVLMGTLGYTLFKHSANYKHDGITYVPVKLGLRQYLFKKMLFVHADGGLGIVSNGDMPGNQTHFSGDVGLGVKIKQFEILADYDGFSATNPATYASWIAIKAGLSFGL